MDKRSSKASNKYQAQASSSIRSDSLSSRLPLPSHEAHQVIPYHRNLNSIYRSDIASRLDNLALQTPHDCRSVALWGSSGFGKTQIALDYAYRRCEDPTCSVFWVCASGRTTFLRDFKKISSRLGLNNDLEGERLLTAVCESIQSNPQWLLVIDGADDLACLGSDSKKNTTNLLNHVPSSGTGITLWTSCDRDVLGMVGSPKGAIHVHQMTCNEGLKLFEMARNQDVSEMEKASTRTLIDELGRHPLAIVQSGIYSQLTSTAVDQYLVELDRVNWDQRINISNHSDIETESNVPNAIINAVDISIQYIDDQNWLACKILHVLSNLSNKQISLSIIRAVTWSCMTKGGRCPNTVEEEMEAALVLLRKCCFLNMATEENGELDFEMPKLIQEVAQVASSEGSIAMRSNLILQAVQTGAGRSGGPQGDMADAIAKVHVLRIALEIMEYLLNKATQKIDMQSEKYLDHILRLCKLAETGKEIGMAVGLLNLLSAHFSRNGLWENMAVVAVGALELRIGILGNEHIWHAGPLY